MRRDRASRMRCARSRYADAVTASTPEPGSPTRSVALGVVVFVATLILLFGLLNVVRPSGGGGADAPPSPTSTRAPSASTATRSSTPSAAGGSSGSPSVQSASALASPSGSPALDAAILGAGDIASCSGDGDSATANLIDGISGAVFTAGDNAYDNGSAEQFRDCYDPTWGRFRDRTRPAPGNHDWETKDLAGYLGYFGTAATSPDGTSWYSYELGAWHVIVLDSDCSKVDGCGTDSPQGRWLADDLAASKASAPWRSGTTRGSARASTATTIRWRRCRSVTPRSSVLLRNRVFGPPSAALARRVENQTAHQLETPGPG